MKQPIIPVKNKILLGGVILFLFVASLEFCARLVEIWYPSPLIDFEGGFIPNRNPIFIEDPTRPGFRKTNPQKLNIFQNQSFLAKKNPEVFRIIFLGESSVNFIQHMLPDLSAQLKNKFLHFKEIEILNVGGKSYGSTRLLLAAKEMIDYRPDLLLIYMGHNEFEEVEQFHLIKPENAFIGHFYYHFALLRLASNQLLRFNLYRLKRRKEAILDRYPDTAKAWSYQFTQKDLQDRMTIFKNNLEAIVNLYQAHQIPIVIGTVPSNLFFPYLPSKDRDQYQNFYELLKKGQYKHAYKFGANFLAHMTGRHQSSNIENSIIRSIAFSKKLPLADVEKEIEGAEPHNIPGETLFRDHCHLNELGNKILIEAFYQTIKNKN